jgi:hypothetical protein
MRMTHSWTPTIHALLRHLEAAGFDGAPRVIGGGIDAADNEVVSWVDGAVGYPDPWSDAGVTAVGRMLQDLHRASAGFRPPAGSSWQPWWMHELPGPQTVVGHCDAGPWYTVAQEGLPVAFVHWDLAGPVDRLDEIAAVAWWNTYLRDDDIAERYNLPGPAGRARQLGLFLDGYGVRDADRAGFVDRMIEFAIRDCAAEAESAGITPESTDPAPLWALAWRARSARWMLLHRSLLERSIRRRH